ncbi:MAG TPA: hypothetical protein VGK46_15095, partial [Saprospiraceae bacterium]
MSFCLIASIGVSQCPQFTSWAISGNNEILCEGESVTLSIEGQDIPVGSNVEWYIGPGATFDPYAGEGTLIGSVPVQPHPNIPGDITIEDYTWTIPTTFCETEGGGSYWIAGIVDPPPTGSCMDIITGFFGLEISCPELMLTGGGEVCEGNCPDNPTTIMFSIVGDDTPFIADLVITASVFPPFEIEDLEISDGQSIIICLEGFFPNFDPSSGILTVPVLAIGIEATVEITSIVSASGCPVLVDPNSISLSFIAAPSANAGNDESICANESVLLSASIGGSATEASWTTSGDGSFDDPSEVDATYTPGPGDIASGEVELTLTATDENGTCIPATSTVTITIEPSWSIDVGPPQTVCITDIVNVTAVITGEPTTGTWTSSGDGDFDDPDAESTYYEPGTLDLVNGNVTLFFTMDQSEPCAAPAVPLEVTFVYAPVVNLPVDIEVCTEDSVTIHIGISGDYQQVTWSTAGDGVLIVLDDFEANYTPGPIDINNQFVTVSVTVQSIYPQCGQTTYNLPIDIIFCDCPPFQTSPPAGEVCAISDMLDLAALLEDGGSGGWSITTVPPGINPATLNGNVFTTNLSDPGLYTVTYTLNSPDPGCPATSSEQIVVSGQVVPDAGADMAFCGPQVIQLNGMMTPPSMVPIMWETLGDGTIADIMDLSTVYTPGPADSIATSFSIVLHVLDPVCGTQNDTVTYFFRTPPFTLFSNDTVEICNATTNGSLLDFSSLIIGGDTSGTWTNVFNVPVDFSNPDSVDFNGIAEGYYLFQYETNSAMSPCSETIYNIIVSVEDCACPVLITQNVPGGICNTIDSLNLDAFVMAGAPGSWQIINSPSGSNPATISGSMLVISGCDQGLYDIRFTFDAAPLVGCPDSADIQIFIQDSITLSISGDTSTCGQVVVQVNAMIGGSATGINWTTSGNGLFIDPGSLSTTYMPSVNDVASANVLLIATTLDTFGFCPVQEDTISLFLVTPPSTTFSALMDTLCNHPDSGSVINLFSFIMEGDGTGFWTDLDGSMVDLSDPTQVDFAGVSAGNYRIMYTTQTALLPCTDSMYIFTVVVEDCGCPPLVLSPIELSLCQGATAELNDEIISADPGTWSIVSGPAGIWPVINGSTLTTVHAAGGNYVLKYTLTDSIPGCPASEVHSLVIGAPPAFTIIDLICDADQMFYEIIIQTESPSITSDFGIVTTTGPGEYSIDSVPAGQDVEILATGFIGICTWTFNVTAPDCSCTLFTEDIADTIRFCPGDTFVLIPIVTGAQGLPFSTWITPDGTKMQPTLPLYEEGEYIWIVRDMAGCEERDTFYVEFMGPEGAVFSTVPPSCPDSDDGQIVIDSILEGSPPFLIQLDSFTQQPVVQFPFVFPQVGLGSHVVAITDMIGCTLEIDIEVESAEFGVLDIGPDVLIQKGDSTLIEPSYDDINVMRVTWNPSMPGQGLEPFWLGPELTTLISVIVEDTAGCIYEDSLLITVVEEETFFIPNVFTPNGDQINDVVFVVTNLPDDRLISFEIFDRWG